ncbi:DNA internalization-related competence protein ComEC/Rec2 [Mogibacterium pumilum]|uniref:DNA internalization-related competence protein ComEC/Rec2 n=1 Tax=Mogibacterium pumilum TaxID=86332 RepID=A0A223ASG2_9FIRM|nr:DNA internalization-related competence protein ComEC/Rec2 [Mogibacterium pumilum]ASS37911.1 DNA internalization-related competence protein ComEC/Rec2 [Mogibacterium pumilum]
MFRRRLVALALSLALGTSAADVLINNGDFINFIIITVVFVFAMYRIMLIRRGVELKVDGKVFTRDTLVCVLIFIMGMVNYGIHVYQMKVLSQDELSKVKCIQGRVISYKENEKGLSLDIKTSSLGKMTVVRCQKWQGFDSINNRNNSTKGMSIRNVNDTIFARKHARTFDKSNKGLKLYGKKIEVRGIIKVPVGTRNPGCFDYRRYLLTKKITYTMKITNISEIKGAETSKLWGMRHSLNNTKEGFAKNVSDGRSEVYGFIKGVTFGETDDIDEDTIREFRENTTAHILAVSGLHVGVIYGMLKLMSMGRHGGIIGFLTMFAMFGYGELTSWNVSTTRAVILTCTAIMAFYLRRPFDLLSSLALSFIILLIYNPFLLFGASFQMSFLAVCGIAFLTDPLGRLIGKFGGFLLAIQLSMIPYTIYTFNKINPVGFLINIPIVALIGLLVPFSIYGLVSYSIIGNVGVIIKSEIFYLTEVITRLNHVLNLDGKYSYSMSSMKITTIIAFYTLLFYICSEFNIVMVLRKRCDVITQSVILALCMSIAVGAAYRNVFTNYEVVFIDVGQGDGIHIRTDTYDVLLDGGGEKNRNIGEKVLKEYFLKNACSDLDISIFTHMHMDHCKGAMELGEVYPVKQYIVPYPYRYQVTGKYLKLVRFKDKIRLAKDVWIEAIWPMDDRIAMSESDDNELNTVYMLHYNGIKIMLTGDLVEADELDMIEYYKSTDVLKCDILKVAHHGSRYSSNEKFIDAVNPRIAVIQVGEHNTYGHPNAGVIERFKKRGIKVYRNDKEGAIGVDISHNKIIVDRMIKNVI